MKKKMRIKFWISWFCVSLDVGYGFNLIVSYVQIADYVQSGGTCSDEFAVGLQNEFQPLKGYDIGQFPGLESKGQTEEARDLQFTA